MIIIYCVTLGELRMPANTCIEFIAALTIPIALIAIVAERVWTKKGIGVRTIQFAAVTMFVPLVLILALGSGLIRATR